MYEKEIVQSKHEISIIVNFDEIFWKKKNISCYAEAQDKYQSPLLIIRIWNRIVEH